jgi:hypothetical protein
LQDDTGTDTRVPGYSCVVRNDAGSANHGMLGNDRMTTDPCRTLDPGVAKNTSPVHHHCRQIDERRFGHLCSFGHQTTTPWMVSVDDS